MQNVATALTEAISHQQAARYAEAEAAYRGVLDEHPDDPSATYLYGLLQLGTGRPAQAAHNLARAVALRPTHLNARLSLGRALLSDHRAAEALIEADAVLGAERSNAQALFLRGTALAALARSADAIDALSRAIAADPANAAAFLHLGNALTDMDQLQAAEAACRAALARDPTFVEAWVSLGFILTSQGALAAGIEACDIAIARQPDCAQAHWNLAVAALLAGDYARGFAEYEWRKRHDRFRQDFVDLPGPVWTGDDPAGRTILIHAEQGFGDTIQFARYVPLLAARGARVVLACDSRLIEFLGTVPGVSATVSLDAPMPGYDAWIDQMSLPRAFSTSLDSIPLPGAYLVADPMRQAAWWVDLPPGRKVGLAWAGNPLHTNDRRRSLPPDAVTTLAATQGIGFVNLQTGPRTTEAGLPDLSPRLSNFADTAALIANLDLVVTVDTAVAHVAGALGIPCWVLLPYAPDWRWGRRRDDSPWYASVRLFRQPAPGAWNDVVEDVTAALAAWRDA
jgi:tetratricopeptide (TPR) repeat protein